MSKAADNVAKLNALAVVTEPRFGALGSGADETSQFAAAAATGVVGLPDDGFQIQTDASTALTFPAGSRVTGLGVKSTLDIEEQSATGTSEVATMTGDGLVMRDLKITFSKAAVGLSTALFLKTRHDRIHLNRLTIDGRTALVGTVQDRSIQLVKSHSAAATDTVIVSESDISGIARAYTRDNADTDAQKIVKFISNIFRNFWRTALTFNAPNGSIEDVAVIGNTFDTHAGQVAGDTAIAGNNNAVGMVGVLGGRVIGNHLRGTYGALTHVEENTDGLAVVGNTARMANASSSDAVMETLANNVSGGAVVPVHQAYLGNVLRSTDGVGSGFGIQLGASSDGANWSLYTGNISAGFDDGFKAATSLRSVLVTNNIFRGTTNAIDLSRAALTVKDNLIDNATQPITVARGGLMGSVHYVNMASEAAALTSFGTSSVAAPLSLTEWTWESDLFTLANGAQFIDIGPMPTRMFGMVSIAVTASGEHRTSVFETSWDGATVSNTSKLAYGAGDITITGPAENAGAFAIQISDASGPTSNCRLQVRFHGGVFVI